MSIYSLDSSFRPLYPLSKLFSWTKAKKIKQKKTKKKLFVLKFKARKD